MSFHGSVRPAVGIPRQAYLEKLRRRCEAVAGFQGGSASCQEQLGIFTDCAAEEKPYLAEPPGEEVNVSPIDLRIQGLDGLALDAVRKLCGL
jgi:hypothetical protein